MSYELHPLCTLFPRVAGAEFDALREDIKTNGLRQAIVLHDGMILDGGNRYRACVEAGVEPAYVNFDGGNLVAFVLSANLHRRHMSSPQQAAIVASAQNWTESQGVGRPRKCAPESTFLNTAEKRAAQSGASVATQRRADAVAKADPALAERVAHGEISLPKAVEQVAPQLASKPAKKQAEPAANADYDGPDLSELVDELQAENTRLLADIKAMEADDLKAEAVKWRRSYDHAVRQQSEAMDKAKKSQDREKWTMRQLARCGKAIGEEDPSKIAAAVEAFIRSNKKD